jgi:hypothetical protein
MWKRAKQTQRDLQNKRHRHRKREVAEEIPARADRGSRSGAPRRRSLLATATAQALADCPFQLLRKAQRSFPRVFARGWPSYS